MTIKVRLALVFAGLSLLLLVGTLGYIYFSQSVARQHEFNERLRSQCNRVASLLSEVKAVDRDLLRVVDRNSIHRLYDEKVLLFNEANELMYSSLDDEPIPYSKELLGVIRREGEIEYHDADGDEIVGVHYTGEGHDYVVLASAFDRYGQKELSNLLRTLLISLIVGSVFIFGASYFYIGLVFRPIEHLNAAIQEIDEERLDRVLPVRNRKDEIDRLAVNYNHMLARLSDAFDMQRAFVNNASHELRTPMARMNAQVERALRLPSGSPEMPSILRTLQNDITAQAELVESLLLLQRLRAHIPSARQHLRVDEQLFHSIDEVRIYHPALHADLHFDASITDDAQLTVHMNPLLLRTAFRNLLHNAARYAPDQRLIITAEHRPGIVRLTFSNAGERPLPAERVFEPFFRGEGAERVLGSGLGLSIVEQVAADGGGQARYAFNEG
ncbi:MAG TPA: HAMP domain-containing protein, partial [Flavobacteriales bacterium]|nr:HAMP domain-containing protein [Flavobacteriales bacterium]